MTSALASLKLQVLDEGLMIKFTPHSSALDRCFEYGKKYGVKFLENG